MVNFLNIFRSVLLANSYVINHDGIIDIDPFDNHSGDDSMLTDDADWGNEEHMASNTWNMDQDSGFNYTDDSVGKVSLVEESPEENWD